MTGQQYTVIADRDKGDNPRWRGVQDGDRVTVGALEWQNGTRRVIVRIERPAPTTDEPTERERYDRYLDEYPVDAGVPLPLSEWRATTASPHPPTREQIAKVLWYNLGDARLMSYSDAPQWVRDVQLRAADAILALIQNGAER